MALSFIKMHGLGNDFVIIDCRTTGCMPHAAQVALLTDRRRGVGCDQLIPLMPPEDATADIYMRILNPDGSESGACGNATRCVADLVMKEKGKDSIVIQTKAGLLSCTRAQNGLITVDMGAARLDWAQIPVSHACDTLELPVKPVKNHLNILKMPPVGVNVGNPHAVFFVDDVKNVPLTEIGPKIENDPLFPERTNVEFVQILDKTHIRMRVWERGAGETEACGSGACAAAVAAIRRGLTGRNVRVTLDGGDLSIEWREADGHVLMTGPVAYVFEGTILEE